MLLKTTHPPESLKMFFEKHHLDVTTYQHEAIFRVGEGEHIKTHLTGAHTKNLFLKDKKGHIFLVIACDDTIIDLKWLSKRLSAGRFSFGKPELLKQVLNVTPGSVTPFALIHDDQKIVRPVLDEKMMTYDILNFHPLQNTMTSAIKNADFINFFDVLGYDPEYVDFS